MEYIETLGAAAKKAAAYTSALKAAEKNAVLSTIAEKLRADTDTILAANAVDIENAKKNGMTASLIDRLTLTRERIYGIAEGVEKVIALPDPIGEVIGGGELPNGLRLVKRRVPIGVIGMIFESRPNVTVDAAVLCFKAGNAVILRGGSDAINSNKALADLMRGALEEKGADKNCIQLVESPAAAADLSAPLSTMQLFPLYRRVRATATFMLMKPQTLIWLLISLTMRKHSAPPFATR